MAHKGEITLHDERGMPRKIPTLRHSGPAGRRLEDFPPGSADLAVPDGLVERRAESAKDHAVLTERLERQLMAFTGELGCHAKGLLLFDGRVIQRCEQAAAPDLRGIAPCVLKESPDVPSTRRIEWRWRSSRATCSYTGNGTTNRSSWHRQDSRGSTLIGC